MTTAAQRAREEQATWDKMLRGKEQFTDAALALEDYGFAVVGVCDGHGQSAPHMAFLTDCMGDLAAIVELLHDIEEGWPSPLCAHVELDLETEPYGTCDEDTVIVLKLRGCGLLEKAEWRAFGAALRTAVRDFNVCSDLHEAARTLN